MRSNNEKLLELVTGAYLSQKEAAERIAGTAGQSVSVRTLQAWLSSLDKKSARACPDWALDALRRSLKNKPVD